MEESLRPRGIWLCRVLVVTTFLPLTFLSTLATGRTIKYETFEEDAVSTVVGHLTKDMRLDGSKTHFKMMKQYNASFIRLREKDGQLTIGESIDREKICRHLVQCLITFDIMSISQEQLKLIHVEVEVKDLNDHSPEFPRKESILEISETASVGTRFPLDVALDKDIGLNYIQSYQISSNSHFTVEMLSRADGVKYAELVLVQELDREAQASHVLELVATDGGTPPRSGSTKIHINVKDFNDNHPVFDQSSVTVEILEDSPVGFLLLDLNAIDPDEGLNGEIVYGFGNQVPSEILHHFGVDRKTGQVTLKSPVDFERKQVYEFDIQASDLGPNPTPSTCKIVVQVRDVNDNAPEITITPLTSVAAGVAYITEAAAPENFVALISIVDKDSDSNGQIHCSLYGDNHFKLQQAYGDSFMIVTTSPLDREKADEYNLTIVAKDLGSPSFSTVRQLAIRISDVNDHAPVFSKAVYEASLTENNAPGAYITTVTAQDADLGQNREITYKLVDTFIAGSPVSKLVSLHPATGVLYALRTFNYEVLKQLQLNIQAIDGGSPQLQSSAVINLKIVDQNDNAPFITQPVVNKNFATVLLPRDAPSGYVITRVQARDADEGANAELSFRISEGLPNLFSVNSTTGTLRLNRQLRNEVHENLRVTVNVSDKGDPSLSTAIILHFNVVAEPLQSGINVFRLRTDEDYEEVDHSTIIIVILAGSCSLLLLAIILIATTCNKPKVDDQMPGKQKRVMGEETHRDPLGSSHGEMVFDILPYSNKPAFSGLTQTGSEMSCSSEDTTCIYEVEDKSHSLKSAGYYSQTDGGRGSYLAISAHCRNGDSDNDADSDLGSDGSRENNHHSVQSGRCQPLKV
ncbi:hypothetical protein DNTS_012336, partial [Danionella cerebrum]